MKGNLTTAGLAVALAPGASGALGQVGYRRALAT